MELLARPGWLNIKRLRPLQMDFPRQRPKIARRRHVTDDDRQRQGRQRPGHVPGRVKDAESPLRRETRPDAVSVHFGTQAVLNTQLSPPRRAQGHASQCNRDSWTNIDRRSSIDVLASPLSPQEQEKRRRARSQQLQNAAAAPSTVDEPSSVDQDLSMRAWHSNVDASQRHLRADETQDLQRFRHVPEARKRASGSTPSARSHSEQMLFSSNYSDDAQGTQAGSRLIGQDLDQRPSPRHGLFVAQALALSPNILTGVPEESRAGSSTESETAVQRHYLAAELRDAVERYGRDKHTSSSSPSVSSISLPQMNPGTTTHYMPDEILGQATENMQQTSGPVDPSSGLLTFPGDGEYVNRKCPPGLLPKSVSESIGLDNSTAQESCSNDEVVDDIEGDSQDQPVSDSVSYVILENGPSRDSTKGTDQDHQYEETSPFFPTTEDGLCPRREERPSGFRPSDAVPYQLGANTPENPGLQHGSQAVPSKANPSLFMTAPDSETPESKASLSEGRPQESPLEDPETTSEHDEKPLYHPVKDEGKEPGLMSASTAYASANPKRSRDEAPLDGRSLARAAPVQPVAREEANSTARGPPTERTGQLSTSRPTYTFKKPPRFSRGDVAPQGTIPLGAGKPTKKPTRRPREGWNIHTAGNHETWELRSSAEESTSSSDGDVEDIED